MTLVVDAARDRQISGRKFFKKLRESHFLAGKEVSPKSPTQPAEPSGQHTIFGEKQQLELCETFIGIFTDNGKKEEKKKEWRKNIAFSVQNELSIV
jgi:hypothetical protein